jgi:hypothetical protein
VSDLRASGFESVSVRLPHNFVQVGQSQVTVEELLKRERNYPALILVARAERADETIKILFVNRNSRAVFVDDTFPNAESEPPQLYVQSPDPARAYALFHFFREYLQRPSLATYRIVGLLTVVSFLVMLGEILAIASRQTTLLALRWGVHPAWDIPLMLVALVLLFRFFSEPKGLWIKPTREVRLLYLAAMALRGDLRDNPLVTLVVSIIATVLATLILKLLHVL